MDTPLQTAVIEAPLDSSPPQKEKPAAVFEEPTQPAQRATFDDFDILDDSISENGFHIVTVQVKKSAGREEGRKRKQARVGASVKLDSCVNCVDTVSFTPPPQIFVFRRALTIRLNVSGICTNAAARF
jgi:hypothetical protein